MKLETAGEKMGGFRLVRISLCGINGNVDFD